MSPDVQQRLQRRPVLMVTGASRGIGAATAILAAARGYDLFLTYRSGTAEATQVAAAAGASGARVLLACCDVGVAEDVARCFAELDAGFGRLDCLLNNAGLTGPAGRFLDIPDEAWAEVLRVNVLGAAMVAKQAALRMARSRGGQGGAIVNLSSRAAALGGANTWVHYAASKGAVDTMTLGLAQELAAEGIRVNAVNPGIIDTEIHARAGFPDRVATAGRAVPIGRAGTAEEVAEAILFLLSPAASYVVGACLPVGGGR